MRYQCFNKGCIAADEINGLPFDDFRYMLQIRAYQPSSPTKSVFRKLFYLMSIDDDFSICCYCFDLLISNIDHWTPKLSYIFWVLLNWGATHDSLGLTTYEKSIVFSGNDNVKRKNSDIYLDFCSYNYEKVICYVASLVHHKPSVFTEFQKLILIRCSIRIALDKKLSCILCVIKDLVSVCMDSLQDWSTFKVVNVSAYLYDETENFHNQIAVVTNIIPRISKCNDICSCLSLTILRSIIESKVTFHFPFQNSEISRLIKAINAELICKDSLLKLYLVVHLVNYIVCLRNIVAENKVVLNDLKRTLETLKWEVVRNHKTYDADLLKGRITYCSSLWSLFE